MVQLRHVCFKVERFEFLPCSTTMNTSSSGLP